MRDDQSCTLMASQPDLQNIMKEIRALRSKIDKLENIVEKRLVGEESPDRYEKKAIAEFEKKKRPVNWNLFLSRK